MHAVFYRMLLIVGVVGFFAAQAALGAEANFSGGVSESSEDAWPGAPGSGWLTPWSKGQNGGVQVFVDVKSEEPLFESGEYLRVEVDNEDSMLTKAGAVRRAYAEEDGIFYNKAHTISFLFRFDGSLDDIERIAIFDSPEPSLAPQLTQGNATWLIRSHSETQTWATWNKDKMVDTALPVVPGQIYRMTVWIDEEGAGFRIRIENLTSNEFYESGSLMFHSDRKAVGGYLNFVQINQPQKKAAFSLDKVQVSTPES